MVQKYTKPHSEWTDSEKNPDALEWESLVAVIEELGKDFKFKASPNYWAYEDQQRAQYYADRLQGLRDMWAWAKEGQKKPGGARAQACMDHIACLFKEHFNGRVSDCMALANRIRALGYIWAVQGDGPR